MSGSRDANGAGLESAPATALAAASRRSLKFRPDSSQCGCNMVCVDRVQRQHPGVRLPESDSMYGFEVYG